MQAEKETSVQVGLRHCFQLCDETAGCVVAATISATSQSIAKESGWHGAFELRHGLPFLGLRSSTV